MKRIKFFIAFFALIAMVSSSYAQEYNTSFLVSEKNSDSTVARASAEIKLLDKFTTSILDEIIYHQLFKGKEILLPMNKGKVKELIGREITISARADWNQKRCILRGEVQTDLAQLASKIENLFNNPIQEQGGKASIQITSSPSLSDILFPKARQGYLTPEEAKEAEMYFIKAQETQELGLNELALEYYYKGIAIDATLPEPIFNMGNAYYAINKLDEAIKCYQKAISMKNDYADAYYNMGNVYLDKHDYTQAIYAYKKAIEHSPNESATYYNLGVAYLSNKQQELAISSFRQAAQLGSTDAKEFLSKNGIVW